MMRDSTRRPGRAGATGLLLLAALSGCGAGLPRLNRSGEPREALPPHVKSVKIDPRTLKPFEPVPEEPEGEPEPEAPATW